MLRWIGSDWVSLFPRFVFSGSADRVGAGSWWVGSGRARKTGPMDNSAWSAGRYCDCLTLCSSAARFPFSHNNIHIVDCCIQKSNLVENLTNTNGWNGTQFAVGMCCGVLSTFGYCPGGRQKTIFD
jgi:hypothetical protein